MNSIKKYSFIDLFSGCGGFSTGMELAGHKCLLGVDFDQAAVDSFARNHPSAKAVHMDISKLTRAKLKSLIDINAVDMVIGGPPCQGFSTVGKGEVSDQRNSLFKEFIRIVKITNPKVVLFENVTGILAKKNAATLNAIFSSFEKLGYEMDARVLSSEEFGVPSRRRRTIIMGVKNGLPRFPKVTHGERGKSNLVTVKEAFKALDSQKNLFNHNVSDAKITKELDRKRLSHIPMGKGIRYEKDELAYLPKKLHYGINWEEISERRFRQTRLQRLDLNTVAPTILTSRTMYYHPTEDRYLTCREASLCQSFPLDFEFKGSQTAIFRQIGNAVPPLLAKSIGLEIKKIKFEETTESLKAKKSERKKFFERAFEYSKHTFA